MAKQKERDGYFSWVPRSPAQQLAKDMWKRSRIMFLIGISGGGKTSTALGLALSEIFRNDKLKLTLTRPQVAIGNQKQPFLPGDATEKLMPWLYPIYDVLEDMGSITFSQLSKSLHDKLELLSIPMARGRTIKNGILIVDEAQNLTYDEFKCILTRIGPNGRIIFTGDTSQSDICVDPIKSPLYTVATKLEHLDTVSTIRFSEVDQQRDELVNQILELI